MTKIALTCLSYYNHQQKAPTISQTAALKCWEKETIEELEKHVTKYTASRAYILKEMESIKDTFALSMAPADGGFYVYVDLGDNVIIEKGLGSTEMCRQLLEKEGVAFTPGVSILQKLLTLVLLLTLD